MNLFSTIEEEANEYFRVIKSLGGTITAIEDGYFQKKISESASVYQESIDSKERIIVDSMILLMKMKNLKLKS